ncbi:aminodeoxychorismate synthase component I [Shewanella gaetbuli]|uniref:aminodeoxychorismate synthase n=1 Tax=Shewanella gaetbuli TaxID=220752 RepID=A0A9X2CGL6_9GAMM|nr:aminodeoxychorismate synthase component I [Shewanella gaetbuli]MCL1142518.1 aminodeoxychorismate synthase component I [Shewanella gaetbuli]
MMQRGEQALTITPLNWTNSTHEIFELVCLEPWAMLLDSAGAEHQDAAFDIIVFNPIATLTSDNGQINFKPTTQLEAQFDNSVKAINQALKQPDIKPLDALNICKQQLYPIKKQSKLPFSGGALGAFSYDLGRTIEQLPTTAVRDIVTSELSIGFYDQCLIYSYHDKTWYYVCYQQDVEPSIVNIINSLLVDKQSQNALTEQFKLTTAWHNQTTKAQYYHRFDQVQQYLLSGDCYQINLTQRFEAEYQGDEWQAYKALTQANKAPFSAFIRLKNYAILSISPERFIQLHENQIETKPIKGTLPRHSDPLLDLQQANKLKQSEKDRAENVMIVDLLRNDIGKVAAPGSVSVPKLFEIESFPAVHHLVSTITAKLSPNYSAIDLLKSSFPGGSITGAPKIRAMEIIEELEPSRRNIYCGSIGYISQDDTMDTSITIRTLITDANKIYCWAGGGVVADSNVDAEYQECFDKVSKILPILSAI